MARVSSGPRVVRTQIFDRAYNRSGWCKMRGAHLSLLTAAIALLGTAIWLALGEPMHGLFWAAITIVWLVTALIQFRLTREIEPNPGRRLLRRFSRLILFWS
jgi:hypothetical protein